MEVSASPTRGRTRSGSDSGSNTGTVQAGRAAVDVVDLTDDRSTSPKNRRDHMSSVAEMVRRESQDLSRATKSSALSSERQSLHKKRRKEVSSSSISQAHPTSSSQRQSVQTLSRACQPTSVPNAVPAAASTYIRPSAPLIDLSESLNEDGGETNLTPSANKSSSSNNDTHKRHNSESQLKNSVLGLITRRPPPIFHRFLDLPPEIRNKIYSLLLTMPPGVPIELPRLTGPEGRRRDAAWVECMSALARRTHKTLFLEILQTSKQIHYEASPIIYGCNTFKYRCGLSPVPSGGTGAGTRYNIYNNYVNSNSTASEVRLPIQRSSIAVTLPTRHLNLLKNIKIAVIVKKRLSQAEHFERAAELIRRFALPGLDLEAFELSWYGFDRSTPLSPINESSAICEALLSLRVSRVFRVLVLGEARMERAMQRRLEHAFGKGGTKVQIKRLLVVGEVEEEENGEEEGGDG